MKTPAGRILRLYPLAALLLFSCAMPTLVPTPAPLPTATPTWTLLPDLAPAGATETPSPTVEPAEPAGPGETATFEPTGTAEATEEIFACPNVPPIRVAVGDRARVTFTDGLPLRVRSSPEVVAGNVTTQIPEGTVFTITDGPVCAKIPNSTNYYVFWKIELEDKSARGWVAEGDLEKYFIEPAP